MTEGTTEAVLVDPPNLNTERRLFLTTTVPSAHSRLTRGLGRRISRSTLYRWVDPREGCPAGNRRVVLPIVKEGSRTVTTEEAVDRFLEAVRTLSAIQTKRTDS